MRDAVAGAITKLSEHGLEGLASGCAPVRSLSSRHIEDRRRRADVHRIALVIPCSFMFRISVDPGAEAQTIANLVGLECDSSQESTKPSVPKTPTYITVGTIVLRMISPSRPIRPTVAAAATTL